MNLSEIIGNVVSTVEDIFGIPQGIKISTSKGKIRVNGEKGTNIRFNSDFGKVHSEVPNSLRGKLIDELPDLDNDETETTNEETLEDEENITELDEEDILNQINSMTIKEIKEELDKLGVDYGTKERKPALVKRLYESYQIISSTEDFETEEDYEDEFDDDEDEEF